MRSFNDVFGVLAQGYATALGLTAQRPLPDGHPATAELAALRGLRSTGGAWDPPALGRTAAAMEHAVLLCHAAGIPLGLGRPMPPMGPLWPAFVPRLRSKERFLDTMAEVQTWLILEDHGMKPRPVEGAGMADFLVGDGVPVENKVLHKADPDRIADHVAKAVQQVEATGAPGILFLNVGDDLALAERRESGRPLQPWVEAALRRALEEPGAAAIDRAYLTWRWATRTTEPAQERFAVHRRYKLVRAPRAMRTKVPNAFADWMVEIGWKPFPKPRFA